ncbi:MAG: DNA repair protein RadA [Myxococcales bacterium]|nr:DNA repair protein RadA [Myxococcales bacterium]
MAKASTRFVCQHCGYASSKWLGRCPECGEWNSLVEEATQSGKPAGAVTSTEKPRSIADVDVDHAPRMKTGIHELDRVLGGGLVAGSLVLLGGDPGIGKSTLLLQALDGVARTGKKVLYVSGEESVQQTALRAGRLGVRTESLHVLAETQLERILDEAAAMRPAVLAVDSVQTMHAASLESIPGSVGQVRETAGRLLTFAKTRGVPVVLVGHVTKDGSLAGPKTLEHVVDCVLYFEGERTHNYRVLRTTKNRFGSTNEIGVFEMRTEGLGEVANPSALFLAERPVGAPGSVVVASVEGSRPILVEIQALVAHAAGMPRRTALGIDPNRVSLLLAVIERRAGIDVLGQDVFVNVAGGVRLSEPASDLGVLAAVASSARSRPVDPHTLCFGEVGLAGEVRAVAGAELRLAEAKKLGFRRCVMPELSRAQLLGKPELELVGVRDVGSALEALLSPAS